MPQNLRNSAAVLLFFQDLCGNLCTVAAGIHGGLFNHAVGFRFAHALVLDQIALGTVHQPDLGNLIPQFVVFLPQIIQAAAAGGGPLVMVQQMIVRSEDDIRRISQELYNLIQTGSRAQGRFSTA